MHLFIMLEDDILTLDDAQEIDDAVDALRDAGLIQVRVWRGGPETDPEPANKLLTTSGLIDVSPSVFAATRDS